MPVVNSATAAASPALTTATTSATATREQRLTTGPVLPTLASLALPNMLAMVGTALVAVAETAYVGQLGREPLAAMAVVFPFAMLMQMFSAGAMGGGISSAVSRALGANDMVGARALAFHAMLIGLAAGLMFSALFLLLGPAMYTLLGAKGEVLRQATLYSNTLFAGIVSVWLTNSLASVMRGTGNMRVPSVLLVVTAIAQVILGAVLGLGFGPVPRLGMVGVALGQVISFGAAAVFLLMYMRSPPSRVTLAWRGMPFQRETQWKILRVGLLACVSPLQSVATVLILTGLVARLGVDVLAGYGIGARLEFLLIPIAFGVGVATVPMVGMAMGRGDHARARRVAWTGGAMSACIVGSIGLAVTVWPSSWATLFTSSASIAEFTEQYLRRAGPAYAFFGAGLTLFFASQGAGRVLGPVLASTLRLAVVAIGGFWLAMQGANSQSMFWLVGLSMAAYGLATMFAVWHARWGERK